MPCALRQVMDWQYARDCACWANETHDTEDHELLVEMAKAWTRLALTDMDVVKAARQAFDENAKKILRS